MVATDGFLWSALPKLLTRRERLVVNKVREKFKGERKCCVAKDILEHKKEKRQTTTFVVIT